MEHGRGYGGGDDHHAVEVGFEVEKVEMEAEEYQSRQHDTLVNDNAQAQDSSLPPQAFEFEGNALQQTCEQSQPHPKQNMDVISVSTVTPVPDNGAASSCVQETLAACYSGNVESTNNNITIPLSSWKEITECQDPALVASHSMDVDTVGHPEFITKQGDSQSAQALTVMEMDDATVPEHQQSVHSFIGPQIPGEDTLQSDPSVPQSFIGPQIPDTHFNSELRHQTVFREPLDSKYSFPPTSSMHCVAKASKMFMEDATDNYLRGCKWSPDGTQVLTNSNDNILRTFTTEHKEPRDTVNRCVKEMNPNRVIKESGIVYDFCWLPGMVNSLPETCRVACCCPGSPIHLWNPQNSELVASYRAFDHCDEVTSAYSVSVSPDRSKLYGGYKNSIRVFDTEYSHHKCSMIKTLNPKTKDGHTGIVSCFSHGAPGSNTFVTGSYSRHVGIYYSLTNELVCLIQGQQGGVTHIMISPDGNRLYTGGRKDPEIVCWDMRNTGHVLCTFLRDVQTNQRIYFDLSQSGRYLVSGNHDGTVQVWDTQEGGHEVAGEIIMKPCYAFQAHGDCTNGVSFNHQMSLLATASGQRHFRDFDSDSDEESSQTGNGETAKPDFSLKIWDIPIVA